MQEDNSFDKDGNYIFEFSELEGIKKDDEVVVTRGGFAKEARVVKILNSPNIHCFMVESFDGLRTMVSRNEITKKEDYALDN